MKRYPPIAFSETERVLWVKPSDRTAILSRAGHFTRKSPTWLHDLRREGYLTKPGYFVALVEIDPTPFERVFYQALADRGVLTILNFYDKARRERFFSRFQAAKDRITNQ